MATIRRATHEALSQSVSKGELQTSWGITPGWWLWATRLRILVVIDGRINTSSIPGGEYGFGLGPMLATLRERFAWWVRFEVDVAKRDPRPSDAISRALLAYVRYHNFRFNQAGFNLDDYDQLWLFGDWPGNKSDGLRDDSLVNAPQYAPLEDVELKIIADWMDQGGGTFATGDHGLLGATLSSRIPRVRAMRRWTWTQGGLPEIYGPTRHETFVRAPITGGGRPEDVWEGDRWPQEIRPVYRRAAVSSVLHSRIPHPLLCSPTGVINLFPDHMHEGEVIPDDEVDLDGELEIPDYSGVEFPIVPPVVLASRVLDGQPEPTLAIDRPRPHVIAHGLTTQPEDPVKVFGLIGVYDGDRVSRGRVVVDSTWHHWLSMNILGFKAERPAVYRNLQAYYRNVGLWLASPAQRASMLFSATWGAITGSAPMAFGPGLSPWDIGERALDVIGRTASQCMVSELVGVFIKSGSWDDSREGTGEPPSGPVFSPLPGDLVKRAVVGSIGAALQDVALDLQEARAAGRTQRLHPGAVRDLALMGAANSRELLQSTLERTTAEAARLSQALSTQDVRLMTGEIEIWLEAVPIRIVAERLLLRDLSDPVLMGDASVSVLVRSGDSILNSVTVEIPQGQAPETGFVDLDVVLLEAVVHEGDELTIELRATGRESRRARRQDLRFEDLLDGNPSDWIGPHVPAASQYWPLWYRIEHIHDESLTEPPTLG